MLYEDVLLGMLFAVALDLRQLSDATKENLVEDYRVVGRLVEVCQFGLLRHAYRREAVDGAPVFPVVAC